MEMTLRGASTTASRALVSRLMNTLLELDRAAHDHRPLGTQRSSTETCRSRNCSRTRDRARSTTVLMDTSSRLTGAARPKVRRCEMISVALRTYCIALLSSTSRVSWSVLPSWTRSIALPTNRPMLLSGLFSSWAMPVVSSPGWPAWRPGSAVPACRGAPLPALDLERRLAQVAHDVDHRLPPFSNCTLARYESFRMCRSARRELSRRSPWPARRRRSSS